LNFPSRENIININNYHIEHTGGFHQGIDNLLNPGSLEWVLDTIQYPLFGVNRYPTMVEKAALLTWIIIAEHVFYDGNKRTGISALKIFLKVNGYNIKASNDELIEISLRIAGGIDGFYSLEDFTQWIRSKLYLLNANLQSNQSF
jgi:death-on-curing protein